MDDPPPPVILPFLHFGLIVTGRGEEQFLPTLFRPLMETGRCTFEVICRIGQRSPITSAKRRLAMVRTGKTIADRDEEEIGLPARRYLQKPHSFVVLVDDLEGDRASHINAVFSRYRDVLDRMLGPYRSRASVHFLTNMLEAYFFADSRAVNVVLGTTLQDCAADVEAIRHPKGDLKGFFREYDEIRHGRQILAQINLHHVLSRTDACASLRTLVGWCWKALGEPMTDLFQLEKGIYNSVTKPQIDAL